MEQYQSSIPLGGATPVAAPQQPRSERRTLVVAGILLVVALGTALSPMLSWRDFGSALKPDESGWRMVDGSLGRGWVVLILAVLLATAGALLIFGHHNAGMRLARATSVAMVIFAGLEWAFGMNQVESGPGIGLWILVGIGAMLILFLGAAAGEAGAGNN